MSDSKIEKVVMERKMTSIDSQTSKLQTCLSRTSKESLSHLLCVGVESSVVSKDVTKMKRGKIC